MLRNGEGQFLSVSVGWWMLFLWWVVVLMSVWRSRRVSAVGREGKYLSCVFLKCDPSSWFCNQMLIIMLLKRSFIGRNNKDWSFYGSNSYGLRVGFCRWWRTLGLWGMYDILIWHRWKVANLSNNQNIFFFPRGLPFHSFICCYVIYEFILHACCHALGFWITMMNACKLNFVGVAT